MSTAKASLLVCVMAALMLRHGDASERSERSVVTFGLMVKCGTQYGLNLNGYGCWCGLGNKGKPHLAFQAWSSKCCPRR